MQDVAVAVPAYPLTYAGPLDTSTLDSSKISAYLSSGLGPSDVFAIWGSQDPSATSASPNLTYIASIAGTSAGQASLQPVFSGWRYLFIQRIQGVSAGNFYASGNLAPATSVAPASVALPTSYGAYVALSAASFRSGFRLALGGNFTNGDVFEVYAADDPSATPSSGSTLLGRIQGGGSSQTGATSLSPSQAQGQGAPSDPTHLPLAFVNVLLRRVSGATAGSAYAWGTTDATSGTSRTVSVTSAYTAKPGDVVFVDTTAADVVVTLPVGTNAAPVTVIKSAGTHNVVLVGVSPSSGPTLISAVGGAVTTTGDGTSAWVYC